MTAGPLACRGRRIAAFGRAGRRDREHAGGRAKLVLTTVAQRSRYGPRRCRRGNEPGQGFRRASRGRLTHLRPDNRAALLKRLGRSPGGSPGDADRPRRRGGPLTSRPAGLLWANRRVSEYADSEATGVVS